MIEYKTKGTCSKNIQFELKDGKISHVKFKDGCDGNLKALSIMAEGMDAEELVKKLKGVDCDGRGTSCGDQLARAVEQQLAK
ncbi:MAG: TIGR03905 family TSCPD domain-containing protein [Treponema sp.]|jgi:uncharacterized protein (TIGR03905 family)|nr:TIGR03905 family TSCPD domain-containing protein [Treponema sp.]